MGLCLVAGAGAPLKAEQLALSTPSKRQPAVFTVDLVLVRQLWALLQPDCALLR